MTTSSCHWVAGGLPLGNTETENHPLKAKAILEQQLTVMFLHFVRKLEYQREPTHALEHAASCKDLNQRSSCCKVKVPL